MPRDLFGDVTRPSISVGNRTWYTLPVSLLSHSAIVLILVALPILAPAVMPSVFADNDLIMITAIVPPTPPLPPRQRELKMAEHPPIATSTGAPIDAPTGINPERPVPDAGWEYPAPGPGVVGGDFDPNAIAPPPPPPPPQVPIRVGDKIRPPLKTRDVQPVYPPMAIAAHIQGVVIIEATISPEGRIVNARLLRSLPMLDQAALDAVRQWEFTPSLFNGVPVPVIMTITVQFTLNR